VQRAIDILEFVAEHPRSLGDVAGHLAVHRSTALRLLQTLGEGGLVRKTPDGRYAVGYRLAGLAQLAVRQFDLLAVAHPHLVALGEKTGHTIHLAALEGKNIIYIDKVEPASTVRLYSQIGRPVPLHTSAVSKSILASLPREQALALLDGCRFDVYTENTITSAAELLRELDEFAGRGWACDDGEFEDFVNCVAAPIHRETGAAVGAVSVTSLKALADLNSLVELVPDLLATASTISRELGWSA
jgi:DNA-binding IclR family transcriptional regulator